VTGGLAAWLGFTAPSAVALIALAILTGPVDLSTAGWVHGLKLATVAVVAQAVWLMAASLLTDVRRRALAVVALVVALAWAVPFAQVVIIAGGAVAGRALLSGGSAAPALDEGGLVPRWLSLLCLALFAGLLAGLAIARAVSDDHLIAFLDAFYRAGALVFGGGHVVLPLLHATVVDPGWVGDDRFLAGYGAAQAVPGPLFTFAGYLGAASSGTPTGAIGGLIALVAIFLPSFLLVFGILPFWADLRRSDAVRRALAGTNAAVVGLLAAALYTPVWTGAVVAPGDVAVAGIALAALLSRRVPVVAVVAACAIAGQVLGPR